MPALIALGLPSPIANATSNVALQPGALASAWAYREGLEPILGTSMKALATITFLGGLGGSLLLVATPTQVFDLVVPWLLLLATIAIVFGKRASAAVGSRVNMGRKTLISAQCLLAVYGGYFGGGVSLMITAAWGLISGAEPHRLAAPRMLMMASSNAAAAIIFSATRMVRWDFCLPMLAGSIIGGALGAWIGKTLSPAVMRRGTILITMVTTTIFFYRAYG
jgi:uncharacterized membrane protein YfcA